MRRQLGLLALGAVAVAYAWPMQVTGHNQNAHYALVKALERGVPYIDETLGETGELQSQDVARHEGHLYTVKAPGLGMAATPTYAAVERSGARTTGDPTRVLWMLNLFTSVVATAILLLLVRDLAERVTTGTGAATAAILGLGALTLPFATLFFSHALGTTLAFACFWLLWRARDGASARTFVLAGALAGLAVTAEHPVVWIVPLLAAYGAFGTNALRRLAAFAAGAGAGVLPLLAFNVWAFGDPLHTPYEDYWRERPDFDTFSLPTADELSKILFSSLGLLVLAPVLAAGAAGVILMYRRGLRAEALVCGVVPLFLVLYFSANSAFGGLGPPRYLTPIMPFALLPLAAALGRFPFATLSLAAVTVFQAVVMTATGPLAAYDGAWLERAADRLFVTTAASLVGITGWYAILPFFAAATAAALLALASLPLRRGTLADAGLAVAGLGAWALVALASYNDWGRTPGTAYVLTTVGLVAGAAVAFALLFRRSSVVPAGAAPMSRSAKPS